MPVEKPRDSYGQTNLRVLLAAAAAVFGLFSAKDWHSIMVTLPSGKFLLQLFSNGRHTRHVAPLNAKALNNPSLDADQAKALNNSAAVPRADFIEHC